VVTKQQCESIVVGRRAVRSTHAGRCSRKIASGATGLAGTPGFHWLKYVDCADSILETPLRIVDGMAVVTESPGNGLRWNEVAVASYRLD
jgi:L-alanine-DL-glutamate epimerase-like enolase superfamily enzyme